MNKLEGTIPGSSSQRNMTEECGESMAGEHYKQGLHTALGVINTLIEELHRQNSENEAPLQSALQVASR
jgi:hypothetical protein